MKTIMIHIPIYEWDVTFMTTFGKKDVEFVKEYIKTHLPNFPEKATKEIIDNLVHDNFNGGETLTNMSAKKAVVIIYKWSDESFLHNVLNHEKRHCVDNILENCHINDKEAGAYLDGYISAELYKQIGNLKMRK